METMKLYYYNFFLFETFLKWTIWGWGHRSENLLVVSRGLVLIQLSKKEILMDSVFLPKELEISCCEG